MRREAKARDALAYALRNVNDPDEQGTQFQAYWRGVASGVAWVLGSELPPRTWCPDCQVWIEGTGNCKCGLGPPRASDDYNLIWRQPIKGRRKLPPEVAGG